MTVRFVFDTSALIGAERGNRRPLDYLGLAAVGRAELVTPIVCVIEWWRGRTDRPEQLLRAVAIEPLPLAAAQAAGMALGAPRARVSASLSIDAAVMAFATLLAAPVVTADLEDMEKSLPFFPGVRLLAA